MTETEWTYFTAHNPQWWTRPEFQVGMNAVNRDFALGGFNTEACAP